MTKGASNPGKMVRVETLAIRAEVVGGPPAWVGLQLLPRIAPRQLQSEWKRISREHNRAVKEESGTGRGGREGRRNGA